MIKQNSIPTASKVNTLLFILLGAIAAMTPLAIDMYLPAMPNIAKDLAVAESAVQMTLSIYIGAFAVGQLIHGPLADSFGRKPVLLIGIFFFAIASVLSAMVNSIETLMIARGFQGFAGAAVAVIIQAIVRDMFDREDFTRVMSFVTLIMTIAPLVGPLLGGHISVWLGWRAIFIILTVIAILIGIAVLRKIPETLSEKNKQSLRFGVVARNYLSLFKDSVAMGLILCSAFSFSGMFAFLTAGSFVYIDVYGVKPYHFGYFFGFNIVAMMVMTSLNGRLVKKVGSHFMLRLGLAIQFLAGVGLFVSLLIGPEFWQLVLFIALYISTLSTIGSNASGLLLSHYPKIAGTASSLSGSLRFGISSLVGGLVAFFPASITLSMVAMMAFCAAASALCYYRFGRTA
ncbi:Bcr/CflA family multidrug efflux MFS transporter [Vibrio caribbeanicus]|uniref:Bcr/CflA family multidrug efflux MFS transporter n=1 Tax=Vibrio caribbeanicus TaxID=701175 RepID=UPI002284B73D|nr:Bcr/CflA family multidrug efflux MFS transporter [Vibrio caribbeanicus]MCY9843158.1 Bcr/CflA family multidrug efflux MFS transporter [Vibrio caribbeanicus]